MGEISAERGKPEDLTTKNLFKEKIIQYGVFSVEKAQNILDKIRGKLSDAVMELRRGGLNGS